MRSIYTWLDEYSDSHQNRINKFIHWICVPLIMLSLLGLLWSINIYGAILLAAGAVGYYFIISPNLALGMIAISILMLALLNWFDKLTTPLWLISCVVFIVAWVGQFIGHYIEGRRPSFFKDIQFLLIGPLWLLSFIYQKLQIRY